MHHGTLLYNADFSALAGALRPNPAKIQSKAVASVRSRVTNIAAHLEDPMPVTDFLMRLYQWYSGQSDTQEYTLTQADCRAVDALVREKYGTWEWNFGHSPDYGYQKYAYFSAGGISVSIDAKHAVIEQIAIRGDFFGIADISGLEGALCGVAHEREAILKALEHVPLEEYIGKISRDEFLSLF
jgi:lipoate-protein ligase A